MVSSHNIDVFLVVKLIHQMPAKMFIQAGFGKGNS